MVGKPIGKKRMDTVLEIRMTIETLAVIKRAAERCGESASQFVRRVVIKAAKRIKKPD